MPNSNLDRLTDAALLLRPLLPELVFVGGTVTGLLFTDPAAGHPRPTFDVDAIVEISSYAEYAMFGDRLRALGFSEDVSDGAPICRWVQQQTILDVMPLNEEILGFSNRWYRVALTTAITMQLTVDLEIRVATAATFLATKFEAFNGRGKRDVSASHDLEDLISVVDGRPEIVEELRAVDTELRAYVQGETASLLRRRAFLDALPGYLLPDAMSQARAGLVLSRLRALAAL